MDDAKDGDVQKKMMPWRLMLPEDDLGLDLEDDYSKKKQKMGGLVLVTSLIDRIPNLGGESQSKLQSAHIHPRSYTCLRGRAIRFQPQYVLKLMPRIIFILLVCNPCLPLLTCYGLLAPQDSVTHNCSSTVI